MGKLKKASIFLLILGISLALITAIGIGEAHRTYSKLKIEGVYALGETIKSVVDSFLGAGVPLTQFAGFETVSSMILDSDSSITRLRIVDNNEQVIFSSDAGSITRQLRRSKSQDHQKRFVTNEDNKVYTIGIPLENKFEKAGELRLEILKKPIKERIMKAFKPVFMVVLVVIALFLIQLYLNDKKHQQTLRFRVKLAYALSTGIVLLSILYSLVHIYNDGIREKTHSLTNSLSYKLSYIKKLDLEIDSFKGIDTLFNQYRQLNTEISYIDLKVNDITIVHTSRTDLKKISDYFRYKSQVKELEITVWVDKKVIYKSLWKSSKNFLILVVAAFFMSALFLNLMFTFARKKVKTEDLSTGREKELCLALVKPLFFIGVFIEGLYASFLPQYFDAITLNLNISANAASFLFTVFFISYGLVLLPAANYCQKHGEKKLFIWSVTFIGISSLFMAFYTHYYTIILVRLVAGLSQGALFIAVQSYILRVTPEHRKTQSMAILIIQYNGGRIAGTAIGALAVNYFDTTGVFLAGGIISFLLCGYVLKFVPGLGLLPAKGSLSSEDQMCEPAGKISFLDGIKVVLKDIEHLKTSFLIGVNAKFVYIGVVCFALPLVMEKMAFAREDIGFVLMLYSAGVLIASLYSSKLADKTGDTRKILFFGALGSGLGLVLISIIGLPMIQAARAGVLLAVGALVLGLFHGFIAAPITTHISRTRTSAILGQGPSISIFRIFERAGNIFGPLVLGHLLLISHYNPLILFYMGGFIIVCGILFVIPIPWSFKKTLMIMGAALFISGAATRGIAGTENSGPDWFQFTKDMPQEWEVTVDEKDPLRFFISPKPEKGELMDKKILILIPKKSSAYVTSLTAILLFFSDKKLYPKFEVVNFNNDKTRGDLVLRQAEKRQADLIFAMGSLSVDFMVKQFKNQQIPVVSVCAKDPVMMQYIKDYDSTSNTNFAFTSINIPVNLQMVYFKELVPELKNIGILYARNNKSAVMTQAGPLKNYAQSIGISVLEVVVEDQKNARKELGPKLKQAVEQMKKNDAGLKKSIFWVTGSTSIFSNFDIINQYSEKVPVIGASPSMVKGANEPGAVMAIGVGFETNAQLASIYAEKILKHDKKPGEFKVGVITPPDIAINFKQVRNINMKIPFSFFELAGLIFNYQGEKVKSRGSILSDQ